jgi:hypothetical protein
MEKYPKALNKFKNIEQMIEDINGVVIDSKRFFIFSYGDYLVNQDLDTLCSEIDKRLESDPDDLYSSCTVMDDGGSTYDIQIKFDDGYEEGTEDDNVDFFCSGHHLCRLTNPNSGEGYVLIQFQDYEAPHIGIDALAEQIKKIQPETRFDAVIMWRDDERLENVTMKMGLGVGADDENIFYNVEDANDMFGLMVGKSDEWILVGFADGANQFNYTAL